MDKNTQNIPLINKEEILANNMSPLADNKFIKPDSEAFKASILQEFDNALNFVDINRKSTLIARKEKKSKSKPFFISNPEIHSPGLDIFREIGNEILELKTQVEKLENTRNQKSVNSVHEHQKPSIFEKASKYLSTIQILEEPTPFEKASKYLSTIQLLQEPRSIEKIILAKTEPKASQKINWHPCIQGIIRSELANALTEFNIETCNINYGPEPKVFASGKEVFICLTPKALEKVETSVPQLRSLLLQKGFYRKQMEELNITSEVFWDYSKELDLHIPVLENVLAPSYTKSTLLYLNLIADLKDELKGKQVLEIGSGCGILATSMARLGANVVAIDISKEAIENTKLTLSLESDNVKKRVVIGESDVYSNIEEITNEKTPLFDYVIFNNPLLKGIPDNELGTTCYAGNEFDIPLRAISMLPKVLKKGGAGYFLVANIQEENTLLNTILGQENLSNHYFTTKLLSKISRFIKPKININPTNLISTVSYEPIIEYLITKLTLC